MPTRPPTRTRNPFGAVGISGGGVEQSTGGGAPVTASPFSPGRWYATGYTGGRGVPGGNYHGNATPIDGMTAEQALAEMGRMGGWGTTGQGFGHMPFVRGPGGQELYLPNNGQVTPGGDLIDPAAHGYQGIGYADAAANRQAALDRAASLAAVPGYAEAARAQKAQIEADNAALRARRRGGSYGPPSPAPSDPLPPPPVEPPPPDPFVVAPPPPPIVQTSPPSPVPTPTITPFTGQGGKPGAGRTPFTSPPVPAPLQPSAALTTTSGSGAAAASAAAASAGAKMQGAQSLQFPGGKRPKPQRSPFGVETGQPKVRSPFQTSGINLY